MRLGLNYLGLTGLLARFSPASLFAAGEPGVHFEAYDPNALVGRRNLLTWSETPGGTNWAAGGVSAGGTVPDSTGQTTLTKTVENTANTVHEWRTPAVTYVVGQTYTVSAEVMAGERTFCHIGLSGAAFTASVQIVVDLSIGAVTVASGNQMTANGCIPLGNGKFRVFVTAICSIGASATAYIGPNLLGTIAGATYTGDGASGIYVGKMQVEVGQLSSYQKVTDWTTEYVAAAGSLLGMWQDAAGTTPVTAVEQPVGLWMDTKLGLTRGSELWNDAGVTFVANSARVSPGVYRIFSPTGAETADILLNGVPVAGQWYEVTFNIDSVAAAGTGIRVLGSTQGATISATVGPKRVLAQAENTSTAFKRVGGITDVQISNVSLKRVIGNHATQSTAGSRPTLSARYNLLTKTEQFSDVIWVGNAATKTPSADGTTVSVAFTAAVNAELSQNLGVNAAPSGYAMRVLARSATGKKFRLKVWSGVANSSSPDFTPSADWQVFTWTTPAIVLSASPNFAVLNDSAGTAGTVEFSKPDVRLANDATLAQPAYQRVNTATDYDTAGFIHYLRFDGTDDSMATGNIDFSTVDKVAVWAGQTKLADAATSVVCELNASAGPGTFTMFSPGSVAPNYSFRTVGSNSESNTATSANTFPAPNSAVLTGIGSISDDQRIIRVNGTQSGTNTADQGSGNFLNTSLFIGRRNNATLPYTGRITSLTARGSAVPTPATAIASMEQYAAQKAGLIFTST